MYHSSNSLTINMYRNFYPVTIIKILIYIIIYIIIEIKYLYNNRNINFLFFSYFIIFFLFFYFILFFLFFYDIAYIYFGAKSRATNFTVTFFERRYCRTSRSRATLSVNAPIRQQRYSVRARSHALCCDKCALSKRASRQSSNRVL